MSEKRARVMIVDDDDDLRETLADFVAIEGFEPVLAENGAVALERLRREPHPQVIVLDLMMPVMSGEAFRHAQLADPSLADIPVVILSAAHDARRICEALRGRECFGKPIDLDRFVKTLRTTAN